MKNKRTERFLPISLDCRYLLRLHNKHKHVLSRFYIVHLWNDHTSRMPFGGLSSFIVNMTVTSRSEQNPENTSIMIVGVWQPPCYYHWKSVRTHPHAHLTAPSFSLRSLCCEQQCHFIIVTDLIPDEMTLLFGWNPRSPCILRSGVFKRFANHSVVKRKVLYYGCVKPFVGTYMTPKTWHGGILEIFQGIKYR